MANSRKSRLSRRALVAIVVAVAAVAAIGVWIGVSLYNPATVMTVNGQEVAAGEYLYYQQAAIIDIYSDIYVSTGVSPRTIEEMLEGTLPDGTPVSEALPRRIDEMVREDAFIRDEVQRLGIGTDAETAYYYEYACSEQWASAQEFYLRNGISYESFSRCYTAQLQRTSLFDQRYFDPESEYYISDEDIKAYYESEYVGFDLITMPSTNGDSQPLTEEQVQALTEIAGEMAAQLSQPGSDTKQVFDSLFSTALTAVGRDGEIKDSTYSAYLSTGTVTYYDDTVNYNTQLLSALRELQVGESTTVVYESSNGSTFVFAVVKRDHAAAGTEWEEYATAIAEQMNIDDFNAYIAAGAEDYVTTIDQRAARYYSPLKVYLG